MEASQNRDQPPHDPQPRDTQIRERTAQRYDLLFRHSFCHPTQMASLLQASPTAEDRDELDWKTLNPLPADFIDGNLRRSEADLLFEVRHVGDGADGRAPQWTCVLVEHQSSPDRNMDLRLLQYSASVIAAARRRAAEGEPDPEILPVLFHHGERPWPYPQTLNSTEDASSPHRRLGPRFEYLLIDQAAGTPADIVGAPLGRLVQLLFYATTGPRRHRAEAVDMLPSAVAATLGAGHELRELEPLFVYLQDSKEEDIVTETVLQALDTYENPEPARRFRSMGERLRAEGREEGLAEGERRFRSMGERLRAEGREEGLAEGERRFRSMGERLRAEGREEGITEGERRFRSMGERLRAEGREEGITEGERRAKVAVVAGFLRAGVGWDVIQTATGLDESGFKALEKRGTVQ